MVQYSYYILIAVYCIYLMVTLIVYLTKPAPAGDASVGWAMGIIYAAVLSGIVAIALLFWKKQAAGLVILLVPLLLLALPVIKHKLTDLYAGIPSFTSIPALTLGIRNTTASLVHVQINCWFSTNNANEASLYKTLDYRIEPYNTQAHSLSKYETNLLAAKSKYISIVMYECIKVQHNEITYLKEIQPCMQFYDEQISAFKNGKYVIVIDATKNSNAFKNEVALLKKQNSYQGGSFY